MGYKEVLTYLWQTTPGVIKYPLATIVFLSWTPLVLRTKAVEFVHAEIETYIAPMRATRTEQISNMGTRMTNLEANVRAIGVHLMGQARLDQMSQTYKDANKGDNK